MHAVEHRLEGDGVAGGAFGGDGGQGGALGGDGGSCWRGPKPTQLVPYAHIVNSELGPPSSLSAQKHVSKQMPLRGGVLAAVPGRYGGGDGDGGKRGGDGGGSGGGGAGQVETVPKTLSVKARRWLGTSCEEYNPGASLSLASVHGSTVHGSGRGAISADH
jgi:hypothetical protein